MSDDQRRPRSEQRAPGPRGGRARTASAPRERRRSTDPARHAAYDVVRAVHERDAYANLVLPGLLRERRVTGRDAAFATELAYGTLRGQGTYDAVMAACLDRPLEGEDSPLHDALRLGLHQILGMRVPDHAAVSETVGLARGEIGVGPSKLVNAVLRRAATKDLATWVAEIAPDRAADPIAHLAVAHSHPAWVVRAMRDAVVAHAGADERAAYAADPAALDARLELVLSADNAPPQVTLVARPGLVEADELEQVGATPGRWSPYAAVLSAGDPGRVRAVREARMGVQDEGSQLVALALAEAPLDGSDSQWLDLCAGPGGKAALLGAVAAQRGAHLTAVEAAEHRVDLVRRSVAGVEAAHPGTVDVLHGDGRLVGEDRAATFDRVLVDAPCTGLGALRRRPESRWRRQPSDVGSLGPLQRDLLRSALEAVRPGGLVAYVTCSPHVAETVLVVDDVVRQWARSGLGEVERVDARPLFGEALAGTLGDGPSVQLWPDTHGTDAMFLALLRRP